MSDPFLLHMPHWPKPALSEPAGTPSARARALLAKLNHPEQNLPPLVHVGGTKGKGSTIAFLRAMLAAAGYKVHVVTSPHIARFNERIVLAGHEIDDAALYEVLERTRIAAGDMALGFFDATIAASILACSETPADIMLLEMGLGGVVDATNVLDDPALTIMTTISYDHMEYMGTTLESIAAFEAGLFKPGAPCVVGYQTEQVWPVLRAHAKEIGTPLYEFGAHWHVKRSDMGMIYADAHGEAELPLPALLGGHQIVNAATAIAALSALSDFNVAPEHIVRGLASAQWKGRLTRLESKLLAPGAELWFDGGHNMAAGQAIGYFVREQWDDMPFYMIFGTTQGKQVADILTPFEGLVERVYGVSVKSEPGSYSADVVAALIAPILPATPADSIVDALQMIAAHEKGPYRVLVFGSLYLWLEATQS